MSSDDTDAYRELCGTEPSIPIFSRDWWLDAGAPGLSPGQTVLLIPRTWLIRQGFLPWRVLFMPHRAFALRNVTVLMRHVWLKWSGPAAEEDQNEQNDHSEERFTTAKAA